MLNWNLIALIQEVILSVSQENLFLGFQSAQLQRLATVSKKIVLATIGIVLSQQGTIKALIRLCIYTV